jgi:hypothetical protein
MKHYTKYFHPLLFLLPTYRPLQGEETKTVWIPGIQTVALLRSRRNVQVVYESLRAIHLPIAPFSAASPICFPNDIRASTQLVRMRERRAMRRRVFLKL